VLASAREGALARLERLRSEREWGAVTLDVRDGRPESVIAARAIETGADLVAVGEHARPRGIWATLGSTAEALVRCSPVPVLLARDTPDHAPERVLVAVDESDHARAALRWAHLLAQRSGAALTALHVFRPVYLGVARAVSGMGASRTLEQEQQRQAEVWLDHHVAEAGWSTGEAVLRIESGDPATALVAAQRGGEYDLVVVGSRGAGAASRMLLGSVATGVLRGASCPVLVVRGRAHDD
jgi:nucleotide-binding universal stress UspA family protein